MIESLLYRLAAVVLVLFAAGHQLGFRRLKAEWRVDEVVAGMRGTRFLVNGFTRTYYDFYAGFGFFVTVLLLFAALVTWQLGGLTRAQLQGLPLITWGLAACFLAVTVLSWRYFFIAPGVMSSALAACLVAAALLVARG